MYGFKEAAYWWNKTLTKVFLDHGYKQMSKDQCVLVKSEGNKVSYWGVSLLRRSNSRRSCFFDRKKCFASGRLKFEPPLMRFLALAEV